MKHIAAYLMAVLGGKANPTKDDIVAILSAMEATYDEAQIELLLKNVEGKNVAELIEEGKGKMASISVAAAPAAGAAAAGAAPAAEEAKEEPKEEEEEEEEEGDFGLDLFG